MIPAKADAKPVADPKAPAPKPSVAEAKPAAAPASPAAPCARGSDCEEVTRG